MANPTEEQTKYINILEDCAALLQKTQVNFKKSPKVRLTQGYISARLQCVEEYWKKFVSANYSLLQCTPREQRGVLPYFLNEEYYKYEDIYLCLKADMTDLLAKWDQQRQHQLNETNMDTSSSSSGGLSGVKLPRIQLPHFSGRYEEFPAYQDLFLSLVHNSTSLADVQKLHYLKTSLTGEAEVLLRHIQVTDSNYNQAWDLLKNRYGNKKLIANSIFRRLFNQKKISTQSANLIKSLLDTTTECLNSLKNLSIVTDSWDPVIVFLIVQKLDDQTHKEWEEHSYSDKSDELPKWVELQNFLQGKFRTLELLTPTTVKEKTHTSKSFHVSKDEPKNNMSSESKVCSYCKGSHYIYSCKEFTKLSVQERHSFALKSNLCFNCLAPNHRVFQCRNKTICQICHKGRHHSLLHLDKARPEENNTTSASGASNNSNAEETRVTSHHSSTHESGQQVLLATALVDIISSSGESHVFRCLIDQGSEASFVTTRVVDLLKMKKTNTRVSVSGISEEKQLIKHSVNLSIITKSQTTIPVKAYVTKNISSVLPSKEVKINLEEIKSLNLADPSYYKPRKIDILLGVDVFATIIEEGLIQLKNGLIAQKTRLGWILSGPTTNDIVPTKTITSLHVTEDNDILRKFWEIENESYTKKKLLTKEEEACEEIYKNTTRRDTEGRYIVEIPLKQSLEETIQLIGDTKEVARKRFQQLERKFERDSEFKSQYKKIIDEYLDMGHMMKLDTSKETAHSYLPHHAVIRNDKDTSKVRIVYDASVQGSNGHSLNNTMMVGPVLQLQPDLRSLIISWRTHKICIVSDVIKMFRMVKMSDNHANLQCILWRNDKNEDIETYKLVRVTFGTAAAPYLAVRTLKQLADDEGKDYPEAADAIRHHFYMDDLMTGHHEVETAQKLCENIKTIMKKGGFTMQKWSSNCEEVLVNIKTDNKQDNLEIKLDKVIRILGLTWDRKEDMFKVKVDLPEMKHPVTKRSILSDVARLFDPFGWLSPVIIVAKMMIQKLWLCSLGWDEELPADLIDEWIPYREQLTYLQNVEVPRWLRTSPQCKVIQIHGLADASSKSYAAVTYLRVVDENDDVQVTIIAARSKIAPLKQLTIPRLELCAALLLAELIQDIVHLLNVPMNQVYAYTDSMVVLSWLQSQPSRWQTFVGNRVAAIQRILDNNRWTHIKSEDNSADIATRGIKANEIANLRSWWKGPEWLSEREIEHKRFTVPTTDLEMKTNLHVHEYEEEKPIWERFSTLTRLKRVLSYCRRIYLNTTTSTYPEYLTVDEMNYILDKCIRYYQEYVYSKEIEDIRKNGKIKARSSLITLTPFLDKDGLLRVEGRLQNANISYAAKHPIIIPKGQHITKLLIDDAHTKTLHGGISQTMTYIRGRYWVIGLKSAVRKHIRSCKVCIIHKAKTRTQMMGQLPMQRVNQHRAFLNTGVDYAGPILIRTSKGRGHHATKGYICLFVCMATKAIHLEAATDLTSQAFIAAFRRFVARRGMCRHLWSDNGTNFVGANKELRNLFTKGKQNLAKEVAELLANDGTTWHFIPPKMPNYGGIWEAGVQSAKAILSKINTTTKLTFEEMSTFLTQTEACLNSRPLCQLDDTVDTLTPLTPGHFLVGEPLISVPDVNYKDCTLSSLSRWQLVQRLTQEFWRKWQSEYLNTLQQRYKWHSKIPAPSVDDVVVIKEDDLPPNKWLLGRVIAIHPGADNLVRVVSVQCKGDHILKRPLSKLICLPKDSEF